LKNNKAISHSDLDILFEHRNKDYGAYELRKQYDRRLLMAFIITCGSFMAVFVAPYILSYFQRDRLNNQDFETQVVLDSPIPKGFVTPEYLPPPPPPEIKNTPPLVVTDSIPVEKKDNKPKPAPETPPMTTNTNSKDSLQNKPSSGSQDGESNQITIDVDEYPSWASGNYSSFQDYIQKNIKMPEIEIVMRHFGTVIITATVNKDGSLSDVVVSKPLSPGLNAEALRVIKAMPRLNPAIYHRHPVKTYMKFPVTFLPPSQSGGK